MSEWENYKISNNSIIIENPSCINLHIKIVKKYFHEDHFSFDSKNDRVEIPFERFNIYKDEVFINNKKLNLDSYKLDEDKFFDEKYLTNKLINSGSRSYNNDEIFFVCINLIYIMPVESPYYGSLLTIASYRIIDDIESRKCFINDLHAKKNHYDQNLNYSCPNNVR